MIDWIKPSEELPEHYDRDILFVTHDDIEGPVFYGRHDGEWFHNHSLAYCENEVLAWCYAPALPDWVEEE